MEIPSEKEYVVIGRTDHPIEWGGKVVSIANDSIFVIILIEYNDKTNCWRKSVNTTTAVFNLLIFNNTHSNIVNYMSREEFTLQFFDILL